MRDAGSDIDAMIASGLFTLCTCVKIALRDGTELGFTDLDRDIQVALASDSGSNPVIYQAAPGMILGDIDMKIGLESDNTELTIPIGDTVAREDVIGRRFNQATIHIFDVNHQADSFVGLPVMKGWIADAEVQEGRAVFEVRSLTDRWNAAIGTTLSPRCRADFGDSLCAVDKVPFGAAVTAVESNMRFTTDLAGIYADQYFRFGEVDFLTGRLSNVWRSEVANFDGTTGQVETFAPMPNIPEVGDSLHLYRGCSKLKKHSDASIPTCYSYGNVERFRGFDRVPGNDTYVKVSIPGSS